MGFWKLVKPMLQYYARDVVFIAVGAGARKPSGRWCVAFLARCCGSRVRVNSMDCVVLTAGRVNPDWVVSCIEGNYLHFRSLAAQDRVNWWPRLPCSDFSPLLTQGGDGGWHSCRRRVKLACVSWPLDRPHFPDPESYRGCRTSG